ncbi:MAG: ADP-forming succinate--CoA ligase subunit beta [Verrucomicrobiales bacterium]
MHIHEFQAKQLFERFKVPTPRGVAVGTAEQASSGARELGANQLVVKAQIHAGGRGKGVFKNGFKGGVHVVNSPEEAAEAAGKMLGQVLVTKQTGEAGRLVRTVLVTEAVDIAHEFYLAILMDRTAERPVIVASREGGVDIEEVAEKSPEKIFRQHIHPTLGLQPYLANKLAKQLGFGGDRLHAFGQLLTALWNLYRDSDCSLVEINPLVETTDGRLLALDAKFGFDDNALYRQKEIAAMRDPAEEDSREVDASQFNLNYIGLDGDIACMVNGAGLAMATMDIIKHHGGEPANFLDVGGGANEEQVKQAFRILASDAKVKAILVNIFGGIMKCDVIAQGIINAAKDIALRIPLIVRLEGTNVEEGRALLAHSGVAIIPATDLADAAKKSVAAAKAAEGGAKRSP